MGTQRHWEDGTPDEPHECGIWGVASPTEGTLRPRTPRQVPRSL